MTDERLAIDLGLAWQEAEAALPKGWALDGMDRIYGAGFETDAWVVRAILTPLNAGPVRTAVAPSPTEALRALTAKLREAGSVEDGGTSADPVTPPPPEGVSPRE